MEDGSRTEEVSSPEFKISLKRRNLKGKKKLCPNCLSQMVIFGELSGWLVPEEYLCEKCGYKGHVALEFMPVEDMNKKE